MAVLSSRKTDFPAISAVKLCGKSSQTSKQGLTIHSPWDIKKESALHSVPQPGPPRDAMVKPPQPGRTVQGLSLIHS